jgi:hypothetical protein
MTATQKNAYRVPYRQLDPAIVPLVRALNRFPAVHTIGSCGGHDEPGPSQAGPGEWWVTFVLDRTQAGWVSLEFLAWAINRAFVGPVIFTPDSFPPWLNWPGRELRFVLELSTPSEDERVTPAGVAAWLTDLRRQFYVTARRAEHWDDDESTYNCKPITD